VQLRAEKAGLSTAAYMRACALGDAGPRARRSPTLNRELAAHAIAELNKAGSNLNQIAHALNRKDWPGTASVVGAADTVKRAALQILEESEHDIAVFPAAQANHNAVALDNHIMIGDSLSYPSQKLSF